MPVDSGQKFIRRNRAPRVHISYEDPYDAEKRIELPFVMGVLSDLSGNAPGVEKAKLEERKFLETLPVFVAAVAMLPGCSALWRIARTAPRWRSCCRRHLR